MAWSRLGRTAWPSSASPAVLTEVLHAKELRIFNLGALFQSRYHELRQSIRSGRLTLARHRAVSDFFGQVVATVALVSFLAWIAVETMGGALTIGDLAVYYLGFQTGLNLLQAVLRSLAGLYEDNLFLTNLYAFLDLAPRVAAPRQPQAVPRPLTRGIAFHDVSFRYPGHTSDALHGIDMTMGPGEVVALVGARPPGRVRAAGAVSRIARRSKRDCDQPPPLNRTDGRLHPRA